MPQFSTLAVEKEKRGWYAKPMLFEDDLELIPMKQEENFFKVHQMPFGWKNKSINFFSNNLFREIERGDT